VPGHKGHPLALGLTRMPALPPDIRARASRPLFPRDGNDQRAAPQPWRHFLVSAAATSDDAVVRGGIRRGDRPGTLRQGRRSDRPRARASRTRFAHTNAWEMKANSSTLP